MEEQKNLKIQGFLIVVVSLLFRFGIENRYSGKAAKSFLRFQVRQRRINLSGPVFSTTYLRGKLAPSAVLPDSTRREARASPTHKS